MANKVKILDGQGTQVFPITHVSAVIDNNGNSVEQVLGAQTDLIQQAQLEVGAVPSDLTPTKDSSHWVTSGGVYTSEKNLVKHTMGSYDAQIDTSGLTAQNCSIGSTTFYMANTNNQRHIALPVEEGQSLIFSAQTGNCQCAWVTSDYNPPYSNGASIPFIQGETERFLPAQGDTVLEVPAGASYLLITTVDGAGNTAQFTLYYMAFETKKRLDELEILKGLGKVSYPISIFDGTPVNYFIDTSTYKWVSSSTYTGVMVDMSIYKGMKVAVLRRGTHPCRIAFLKSSVTANKTLPFYCKYASLIQQQDSNVGYYDIPDDCNYMYIYTSSSGYLVAPYIYALSGVQKRTGVFLMPSEEIDTSVLTGQDCSLGATTWYMNSETEAQRHIAIPVNAGEQYHLQTNGGWFGFLTSSYNPPYSNGDAIPYVAGTSRQYTQDGYITIPSGCSYLCLNTVDGAGVSSTWTVTKGVIIESVCNQQLNKLRIAHWNVGHFALGTSYHSLITHSDYEVMRQKWAERINSINADVLLCCEYSTNFVDAENGQAAITARSSILPESVYKYALIGSKPSSTSYMQTATFSNIELNFSGEKVYPNTVQAGRYYQYSTVFLNGKKIRIVETHLDFNQGEHGAEYRVLQMQKLISDFSDEDYVIIGGDFNSSRVDTEFVLFKDAGYTLVNLGYVGELKTYPAGDEPQWGIDNILCKGFTVNGVNIVNDAEISDHCCIYADFTLIN